MQPVHQPVLPVSGLLRAWLPIRGVGRTGAIALPSQPPPIPQANEETEAQVAWRTKSPHLIAN